MAEPGIAGDATTQVTASDIDVVISDCGIFNNLPQFSLRNGDVSDVVPFVVRPSIAQSYHWVPVQGLPPSRALERTELFIKSAAAQLVVQPVAGLDAAKTRKAAIVLGVARAAITSMYEVLPADIIPGESKPPMVVYSRNDAGVERIRTATGLPDNVRAVLTPDLALTETERAAIPLLLKSALGVPPLQGYSIIMTDHHYLSEASTASRRAFKVVEQQLWKGTGYGEWFTSDLELIKDLLWHKSAHPIRIPLKEQWACDANIAASLRAAGVGGAASRLPAAEPELRAANSMVQLLQTVRPYFNTVNSVVDYSVLTNAIDAVGCFTAKFGNVANAPAPPVTLPPGVPASVTDRRKALTYLETVMKRNTDVIATAYGFYVTLSERSTALGGEGASDTLKSSFALKKLRTQSIAAYTLGAEYYGDYASAKSAMRAKGEYEVPGVIVT